MRKILNHVAKCPKLLLGVPPMFFRRVLGRRNALAMGVWGTRRDPTQLILPPTNI
ncbi:MAG: hypothetical protein AAGI69_20460 [Cyanobacteria bacterium P01_H01_bin.21]